MRQKALSPPRRRECAQATQSFLLSASLRTLCVSAVKRFFHLAAMTMLLTFAAYADVLTVGETSSQFKSIPDATAAAKPGDTIRIAHGTYVGQIILDKSLVLEGVGKPVLRGAGRGSVVIVVADHCTLRGFVIVHSGGDLQAEDSGLLLKSNDNLIEDNELRDVLYGIYLYHSARNTIRRNTVRGRAELEVGGRGAGLHLWNSPDNTIEDNSITEARDGMYIQSSHRNTIRRNRVSKLRYGLHYMNSDDNEFDDNVFTHNVAGAAIMYSRRLKFRRNAFVHNRGFSSFGILFQDCEDNLAEENFIVDNATGIFMEALRRTSFRRNVIAENDLALHIFSNSENNLFTENNFIANLSPLRVIGRRTNTRWNELRRGNYWSDYDGYDLNEDGIGDVAHKVRVDVHDRDVVAFVSKIPRDIGAHLTGTADHDLHGGYSSSDEGRPEDGRRQLFELVPAFRPRDPQRAQLAVQCGTFHAHEAGGARDVAVETRHLGFQVFALEDLARLAQWQRQHLGPVRRRNPGSVGRADIRRQHVGPDRLPRLARRHDEQPVHDISQLPDVARPVIGLEQRQGVVTEAAGR